MVDTYRPGLLVSVRSAQEAASALAGGADLIDVKEPTRGPLGAAEPRVMEEVIAVVGGSVPVSVALGEWSEWAPVRPPDGCAFAKWGLSRLREPVAVAVRRVRDNPFSAAPVLVAYADHERAQSPEPEVLAEAACALGFPAFLIDTAVKDGTTLLDWMPRPALARIRTRLADFGVRVAFAGSLNPGGVRILAPLRPDWIAVRGAVCTGGRTGTVCPDRVRQLRAIIAPDLGPVVADSPT